jgi:hypothetical protein
MLRVLIAAVAVIPCVIVLTPAIAATVMLFLFAATVRAIARLFAPSFMTWGELIEFDRTLGWKPRPRLNGHYLVQGDDVFEVVTDEEGWPGRRSLDQSPVVAIGDSFAFGYGVDAHHTFAEVGSRVIVKGVGAPGYSMVQGVLLMEQLGQRLKGKLIVWFVFLENDIQDNLAPEMRGYRAPFARLDRVADRWDVVANHLSPAKWECSNLDVRRLFPMLCVPGPVADRAYAACDYLIERARTACLRAGAQLVVLTIPDPRQLTAAGRRTLASLSGNAELYDVDLPDRRIAESCRRHQVPVLAGKDHLSIREYKRREGIHWNERGHRRIASLLAELHASFCSGALDSLRPRSAGRGTRPAMPAPARAGAATSSGIVPPL